MLTQEQLDKIIDDNGLLNKKTSTSSLRGRALLDSLQTPPPTPPTPTPTPTPVQNDLTPEQKPGFFERIKNRVTGAKEEQAQATEQREQGQITRGEEFLRQAGAGAEVVAETAFDTLIQGLKGAGKLIEKATPDFIDQPIIEGAKKMGESIIQSKVGQKGIEALQAGGEVYNKFKQDNPRVANNLESVFNILELVPAEQAVAGAGKVAKRTFKEVSNIIPKGKSGFTIKPVKVLTQKSRAKATTLEDIASPKFTLKEKAKAIKEGRVEQGAKAPLLGKAPDIVEPSQNVKKISETFRKYVDDANNLDQFSVATAAQNINKELAGEIRPELGRLPFPAEQKKQLFDEWNFVKKEQAKSAFFNNSAVKKFQQNTDDFFKQVNNRIKGEDGKFREWTMEDLWDLRIAYDQTKDASRIKKFLSKSDLTGEEDLMVEMWLDNRNILNQFIKDEASKIGSDVGAKWVDMSDLYDIISNISLKGDIDLVGEADVIRKFLSVPIRSIKL